MQNPNQSAEIDQLITALSEVQSQIIGAKKDSKNTYFKSSYADLMSTWEAARDPLTKNGLAVVQTMDILGGKTILVTTLGHKSGQWIKSFLPLTVVKEDPQGIGSAITYARRYALAAILNICPFDDDGESAMEMSGNDKKELFSVLNGDTQLIDYFCKRFQTKDLNTVNRSQKTQIIEMVKKRNQRKEGEKYDQQSAAMA